MSDRLTVAQIAALAGIKPATWRAYVHRDQAPRPVEHLDARTPLWDRAEVTAWANNRRTRRGPDADGSGAGATN